MTRKVTVVARSHSSGMGSDHISNSLSKIERVKERERGRGKYKERRRLAPDYVTC